MRPLLVSEVVVAPSADVGWALGVGTLIVAEGVLRVLGDDLAPVLEIRLPEYVPLSAVTVCPDRSRVALASSSQVQVLTLGGDILWAAAHRVPEVPASTVPDLMLMYFDSMVTLARPSSRQ